MLSISIIVTLTRSLPVLMEPCLAHHQIRRYRGTRRLRRTAPAGRLMRRCGRVHLWLWPWRLPLLVACNDVGSYSTQDSEERDLLGMRSELEIRLWNIGWHISIARNLIAAISCFSLAQLPPCSITPGLPALPLTFIPPFLSMNRLPTRGSVKTGKNFAADIPE